MNYGSGSVLVERNIYIAVCVAFLKYSNLEGCATFCLRFIRLLFLTTSADKVYASI